MARARMIKPSFFTNDELAECHPLARLLFAGLWCHADREGRLEDRPKKLKAEVLPYDDGNIDQLLSDLQSHGFILRYQVEGTRYIQVLAFVKHQNPHIKEAPSSIPAPDSNGASTVLAPEKHGASRADPSPSPSPDPERDPATEIRCSNDAAAARVMSDLEELETWWASLKGRLPPLNAIELEAIREAMAIPGQTVASIKASVSRIFEARKAKGDLPSSFKYFLPALLDEAQRANLIATPIPVATPPPKKSKPRIKDQTHYDVLVANGHDLSVWANPEEFAHREEAS